MKAKKNISWKGIRRKGQKIKQIIEGGYQEPTHQSQEYKEDKNKKSNCGAGSHKSETKEGQFLKREDEDQNKRVAL